MASETTSSTSEAALTLLRENSEAALAAVAANRCATRRLTNHHLRDGFEKYGMNATVAALSCAAFFCTCRDNRPDVDPPRCDACMHTEYDWAEQLWWWELASDPVWGSNSDMQMSPERVTTAFLRCDDPDWEAWRLSKQQYGSIPNAFLRNLQPARLFLPEAEAGECIVLLLTAISRNEC